MFDAILNKLYFLLFAEAPPAKIKHVHDATSAARFMNGNFTTLFIFAYTAAGLNPDSNLCVCACVRVCVCMHVCVSVG